MRVKSTIGALLAALFCICGDYAECIPKPRKDLLQRSPLLEIAAPPPNPKAQGNARDKQAEPTRSKKAKSPKSKKAKVTDEKIPGMSQEVCEDLRDRLNLLQKFAVEIGKRTPDLQKLVAGKGKPASELQKLIPKNIATLNNYKLAVIFGITIMARLFPTVKYGGNVIHSGDLKNMGVYELAPDNEIIRIFSDYIGEMTKYFTANREVIVNAVTMMAKLFGGTKIDQNLTDKNRVSTQKMDVLLANLMECLTEMVRYFEKNNPDEFQDKSEAVHGKQKNSPETNGRDKLLTFITETIEAIKGRAELDVSGESSATDKPLESEMQSTLREDIALPILNRLETLLKGDSKTFALDHGITETLKSLEKMKTEINAQFHAVKKRPHSS
jgi:hypothetical protein